MRQSDDLRDALKEIALAIDRAEELLDPDLPGDGEALADLDTAYMLISTRIEALEAGTWPSRRVSTTAAATTTPRDE